MIIEVFKKGITINGTTFYSCLLFIRRICCIPNLIRFYKEW